MMAELNNYDRLKSLMEPILRAPISMDTSTSNTPKWDSMAHLMILSALSEEFNLELSESDVEQLVSVESILKKLSK